MNESTESVPGPVAKPVRILVAEDSPLNQQVALKQLEKLGFQAEAVSNGTQAVEAWARTPYDIILMDCQMPEMSGYEAAWQIRNREKELPGGSSGRNRTSIIAMTANSEADNRERCLTAGMDGFINKPVQLPELEAAVLRALAERAAAKPTEEVIDPVVIAGLRQLRTPSKPDPLAELIELFLREAPTHLDTMQQAVAKNDAAALASIINAATTLKGASANLGARNLAALCDEVEQVARSWTLADAQVLIERARQELKRVEGALNHIRGGPAPAPES
jgi:CheY-like chemotaxis protein